MNWSLLVALAVFQVSHGQDCDFDSGNLCGWNNNGYASMSWEVTTARYNGWNGWAKADHTTNSGNGKYALVDSTSNSQGDNADLVSATRSGSGCLKFWYNMLQTTGSLKVYTVAGGQGTLVLQRDGDQGNKWHEAKVVLPSGSYQVLIRHIRGELSVETGVAIDDISFSSSACAVTPACGTNMYGTRKSLEDEFSFEFSMESNETSGEYESDESDESSGEGDLFRRILDGEVAQAGQFPMIAHIRTFPDGMSSGSFMQCGGTMVSPNVIVTAAHCFEKDNQRITDGKKVQVHLGEQNVAYGQTEDSQFSMNADRVIIHPQRSGNRYDIALVLLPYKVLLDKYVNVACMPSSPVPVGASCVAAGWGLDESGSTSAQLRFISMIIQSASDCTYSINADQVCAMVPSGVGDVCQGDSGGPLLYKKNGAYQLVGAVSFGDTCALGRRTAGIYANVYYFKDWINSYM